MSIEICAGQQEMYNYSRGKSLNGWLLHEERFTITKEKTIYRGHSPMVSKNSFINRTFQENGQSLRDPRSGAHVET